MRVFLISSIFVCAFMLPDVSVTAPLVPCDGPECQACHIVTLGQNIINFLVGIAAFIAVIVFAWGGLQMVTAAGNMEQVKKAKDKFTSVLVGIVIVLAGWLIVDTVMKYAFVGSALDMATTYGPWNQIQCVDMPIFAREGKAPGAVNVKNGVVREGSYSHTQAERILQEAGIHIVSSGNCSDPNVRTCTSLAGMREDTVRQILRIKEACGDCAVTVTGGTETGHASGACSHGNGCKVDIDDGNQALNNYLERTLRRSGSRGGAHGGPRYVDACGNEYVKESSHWDISIPNGSCPL